MTTGLGRRTILLAGAPVAIAPMVAGEERGGQRRIAVIAGAPRSEPNWVAFEELLGGLGYREGGNLTMDFLSRAGEMTPTALKDAIADSIRRGAEVIVTGGPERTLKAAVEATHAVPIVMVAIDYDPIAKGYVASLARPGGNVTGVFFRQLELSRKRLELFCEAAPHMPRITVLWDAISADQIEAVHASATAIGVALQSVEMREPPYDYESALRTAGVSAGDGLMVPGSPFFFRDRDRLAALALNHRLPSAFAAREWVDSGGLMSYGASLTGMARLTAEYVGKILQGAKPAELPVQQPTTFELVINLKTANALGLTIPQSIIFRADEVVE